MVIGPTTKLEGGTNAGTINKDTPANEANSNEASNDPATNPDRNPDVKELHAEQYGPANPRSLPPMKFNQVESDSPLMQDSKIGKKLLKWFKVGVDENSAVLSEDGKYLVIASDGPTGYKQIFNHSWLYWPIYKFKKLFGMHHRNYGIGFYYNSKHETERNTDRMFEPKQHIREALKADQYKVLTIHRRSPETGDFDKKASEIVLLSNFTHLVDRVNKYSGEEVASTVTEAAAKKDFANYYTLDLRLSNPQDTIDFKEADRIIAEGFYQAHGYDELHIQHQALEHKNMASDDLSYYSLPWTHLYENDKKEWQETDPNSSHVTIVRPKARSRDELHPFSAYLHAYSEIEEGQDFKDNDEFHKLANTSSDKNSRNIQELNREIQTSSQTPS